MCACCVSALKIRHVAHLLRCGGLVLHLNNRALRTSPYYHRFETCSDFQLALPEAKETCYSIFSLYSPTGEGNIFRSNVHLGIQLLLYETTPDVPFASTTLALQTRLRRVQRRCMSLRPTYLTVIFNVNSQRPRH